MSHTSYHNDPYNTNTFQSSRSYDAGAPAGAGPYATYGYGDSSGAPSATPGAVEEPSGVAAFKTPLGLSRLVLFLFAMILMGCAASFKYYKDASQFQFLVASGVLTWLYSLSLIAMYFFRTRVDAMCGFLSIYELCGDGIFFLFNFFGGITSASKCAEKGAKTACDEDKNSYGAIAFSFLTSFLLVLCFYLSYKENKRLEQLSK